MDTDTGRVPAEPGSREPSQQAVSAASGFDPSRIEVWAAAAVVLNPDGTELLLVGGGSNEAQALGICLSTIQPGATVRVKVTHKIGTLACDSDGSGEAGETALAGSTVGDSAGRNGIARTQSDDPRQITRPSRSRRGCRVGACGGSSREVQPNLHVDLARHALRDRDDLLGDVLVSRSGYSDDCWGYELAMWRGQVASAIRGKRGQAFLLELVEALDAMPEKRLIAEELESAGNVCAIGSVGLRRGIDMSKLDVEDPQGIANAFGIAHQLVSEIEWMNDEAYYRATPEQRWQHMRDWAASNLKVPA